MKRAIILAGTALAIVGFYGPWVGNARNIAGLSYNALDLAEFCKFMIRAASGPLTRELFLVPIVACALLLALWASQPKQNGPVSRYVLTGVAALFSLVPLPPYPYLLRAYSLVEDRGLWELSLAGFLAVALVFALGPRVEGRWRGAAFVLLALAGAVPPLWEFLSHALPAISALYGMPAVIGWGLMVMPAGFGLVILGGAYVMRDA